MLEFDMFLDYWESYIAHHKRIDGTSDEKLVSDYKNLFKNLTHSAYDDHVELTNLQWELCLTMKL